MDEASFQAVPVTDDVFWVGAIDWELRNFHGYTTRRGSTYNAYLVLDEKVTLIDTVKKPFFPIMMERIRSVVEPQSIRYVVSNHSEMDHSGGLPDLVRTIHPEKVFASKAAIAALHDHFHWDLAVETVTDGQRLSLGRHELQFLDARMLHWPESMFSFLADKKLLFPQDAFGMHWATRTLFADSLDNATLYEEAAAYYANILMPYSPLVARKLAAIDELALQPEIIAPDHGPIWRHEHVVHILEWYRRWSARKVKPRAVVVYDTMWGSTARMADALADGLADAGIEVILLPLSGSDRSDVATATLESAALVVGSPTLNANLLPRVADVLTYLRGLKPPCLIGAAFGSYGWGERATADIRQYLESMKIEVLKDTCTVRYVPDSAALAACTQFGRYVGNAVNSVMEKDS